MTLKKNSKLKNVKDIYGAVHKKATVLNIYKNVVAVHDQETGEKVIVHKTDLGLKPEGYSRKMLAFTGHFDLKKCQRIGKPSSFEYVRHYVRASR